MRRALKESCTDEKREHSQAVARLEKERGRIQHRIDAMYIDKLDGKVSPEFYDRMLAQWRDQQDTCARDIARLQAADDTYMNEGVKLLEMAQGAHRRFGERSAAEKSNLLKFLVSNCSWKNGELIVEFLQPFDLLAEAVDAAPPDSAAGGEKSSQFENWRPLGESNPCFRRERPDVSEDFCGFSNFSANLTPQENRGAPA